MTFEQAARKKGHRPSGPPFAGRVLLYSCWLKVFVYSFGSSLPVVQRLVQFLAQLLCTGSAQALPKPYLYSLTPKPYTAVFFVLHEFLSRFTALEQSRPYCMFLACWIFEALGPRSLPQSVNIAASNSRLLIFTRLAWPTMHFQVGHSQQTSSYNMLGRQHTRKS